MTLADKIINCRKKNGWTQEELSNIIGVSKQELFEWESSISVPNIKTISKLSEIFNVSTDYLLKEELKNTNIKIVTKEEAEKYLNIKKQISWQISIATIMCILSPLTLIMLAGLKDIVDLGINDMLIGIAGMLALFILVIIAIILFVLSGFKNEDYSFLDDNEPFRLSYGVDQIVIKLKKKYKNKYIIMNLIGIVLCVGSPIPLIISGFINEELFVILSIGVLFLFVSIAVFFFVLTGIQYGSMNKLLIDSNRTNKKNNSALKEVVSFTYWGIVVGVFLLWNFKIDNDLSWIVFVISGSLFPLIMYICNIISNNQKRTN